jgi:hypothetical protein
MAKATRYWTFLSNPKRWQIDRFLESDQNKSTFIVMDWQIELFEKYQFGIVRVGHDHRTLNELNGHAKLERGIYAIVQVIATPVLKVEGEVEFVLDRALLEKRYRVDITYRKKLLQDFISLDELINKLHIDDQNNQNYDRTLAKGRPVSCDPLNPNTFKAIAALAGFKEN